METHGSPDSSSPLAEFLQARIERVVQGFTATSTPGVTPSRRALERFLVALDELAAAADALGGPKGPSPEASDLIVLVAGDEAFAAQIRGASLETLEIASVDAEERSVLGALARRPSLVVASGASGLEALQRLRKLQPHLPALVVASGAEAARLADQFASEPVIVLREPGAGELGLAIRALVAAPVKDGAVTSFSLLMEPRSYAHLAGLLPRALERTVHFDVGAAVIARPDSEPLVDVYAGSDCSQETAESVRSRAMTLFRIVCGGAHAEEQALAADRPDSHLQSSMYVPLASEGRVVGLTYLAAFRPDAFSPEDERVLSELASHASGAYRRLEASVHRLRLSPRQSQVLALIASGLSDKEVASRLGLAHRTVRTHVDRLLREHGLRSRTEAVTAWLRGQQD